jgi:Icc protein
VAVVLWAAPIGAAAPTITRVQLVTVTDTTAVLTWETNEPADTVVHYGLQSDRLDKTASSDDAPGRFHYCEIRGLRPGTEYHCVCQSGSARSGAGPERPGRFTTLVPPPGKELFSFATMTDLHVGQQRTARLVLRGKTISEGVHWREPGVPFWQLAVGASIDEINARRAEFTIIKGDITEGLSVEEFPSARRLLSRLKAPFHVVRGNHDALDPFLRTFGLSRSWYSFEREGVHFVVLDTEPFAASDAALGRELAWLARDLRAHERAWTFVFVHRPIEPKLARTSGEPLSEELLHLGEGVLGRVYGSDAVRTLNKATGRAPNVSERNARRLAELLRRHGRIAGVFAGHLHRNYVGYWPEETGDLPYVETASTKEYPCGYAITRVFTGGYMHNYYVPRDARCLEWSATTQNAYAKLGLQSKAGSLAERSFVVRFDKLSLAPTTRTSTGEVRSGK